MLLSKKILRSDIRMRVPMAQCLCSDVTGNLLKKTPKDPLFSKKIVGVFFNTSRNLLRMGLISLGGAAKV